MAANRRKNLLARIVTPGGDDPLLLRLVAPTVIRAGVAVSGIALVGQGGAGGYAYSILTGSAYGGLPPGLTLNADGTITGTPTTPGNYAFVAQVQDSDSSVYTASFSIRILSRMFRKHKQIRNGEVDLPYTFTLKVAGNTGAVTWSIVSGNLPAGLSLDSSTGVINGTPSSDSNGLGGISYFTARATDGGSGETLDLPDRIVVHAAISVGFAEEFLGLDPSQLSVPTAVRGRYYEINGYSSTTAPGVRYSAINLPQGLTLDSITGVLSGVTYADVTPVSPFPPAIMVTAKDSLGASSTAFFYMPIVDDQPAIQPQKNSVDVGATGSRKLNFIEGIGISLDVSNNGLVTSVEISATGGEGGSVESVGGASPDSSGNVPVIGTGAADVSVDSSGQLVIHVESGGSVASVGGALPDSSGAVAVTSPDGSVGISVDSSGALALSVPNGGLIYAEFEATPAEVEAGFSRPITIPYSYAIDSWRITAPSAETGNATFDVLRKTTLAGSAASIVGSTPPSVTGANAAEGSDMSGWTTAGNAGDLIVFQLSSVAAFTSVRVELRVTKQ